MIGGLKENSVTKHRELTSSIEEHKNTTTSRHQDFVRALEEHKDATVARYDEFTRSLEDLKNLPNIQNEMLRNSFEQHKLESTRALERYESITSTRCGELPQALEEQCKRQDEEHTQSREVMKQFAHTESLQALPTHENMRDMEERIRQTVVPLESHQILE